METQPSSAEAADQRDAARTASKKKPIIIALATFVVLGIAGGGIALGVSASQAEAYDSAVQEHNSALAELVDAQNVLPQAEILWINTWNSNYAESALAIGRAPEAVIGTQEAAAVTELGERLTALKEDESQRPESTTPEAWEEAALDESKLFKTTAEGGNRADREQVEQARDDLKLTIVGVNREIDAVELKHDELDQALAAGAPALAEAAASALKLQAGLIAAHGSADAGELNTRAESLRKVLEAYEGDGNPPPEPAESEIVAEPMIHQVKVEGLYDAQALAATLSAYVKSAADFQSAHADQVAAEQNEANAANAAVEAVPQQWSAPGGGAGGDAGDDGGGYAAGDGGTGSSGGGDGGWTPPYIPPTACEATNTCINNNI